MKYWTWAQIKAKMEQELDLEGEVFIDDSELREYANDAIDIAESQIHTLYDDYFLANTSITLVSGTSEYTLPTNIYAMKIRSVIFRGLGKVYEVAKIPNSRKLMEYELDQHGGTTEAQYSYFITNSTAGSPKILFTPAVYESGEYIKLWFLRNANRLEDEDDVCDIPEFINFVFQYMKVKVYEKEGHPNLMKASEDLAAVEQDMVSTLAGMIADGENKIEPDMSLYEEMS
jgi:hypothetical protein